MPQAKTTKSSTVSRTSSTVANKAAKAAFSVAQTSRENAENVVRLSHDTVKEIVKTGGAEAKRANEKMFAMGRENSTNMVRSADTMTKTMVDAIGMSRDNMETCVECTNIYATLGKEISTEISESCNQYCTDMMELSKDAFACRNINDMMELQTRMMRTTMDCFFGQSMSLSKLCLAYATDAMEPINQRINDATMQMNKTRAA